MWGAGEQDRTHGLAASCKQVPAKDPYVYINLRLSQPVSRGSFTLENTINENPILSVTKHEEMWMVEEKLEVPSRYKTGVAHVYVYLAARAVSTDDYSLLPDHIFELAAFQPCDSCPLVVWVPLHFTGASWGTFKG